MRALLRCAMLGVVLTTFTSMGANPSASEIASQWASFSGGMAGKVMFNQNNKAMIMDLTTGNSTEIANFELSSSGTSGAWGKTWGCKISPDGKRVAAQNFTGLMVCNIDGTNFHMIWNGSVGYDMIAISWDGNDKIYYSQKTKIVYTDINADNTAGTTHDVVLRPPEGSYKIYTSAQKNGDYISTNEPGHAGLNYAGMYKISTGEFKYVVNGDCCQARMIMDGSGRLVCHENVHTAPASIFNWNGKVGSIPVPSGCGINNANHSYDTKFLIVTGDNDLAGSPGCINQAYILKTGDYNSKLYLGDYLAWPDVWAGVAGQAQVPAPVITPADVAFSGSATIKITCTESGAAIYYTTNGNTPTETSTLYAGEFAITASTTIKAKAFKSGMSASNVAEKAYVSTTLLNAEAIGNTENGLWYKYYEGTWNNVPNFSTLASVAEGGALNLDISTKKIPNNFGYVFTGYINVPVDGLFTFYLGSDDGSKLYIGPEKQLVIDNDGLHAAIEKPGSIGLRQGKHSIVVEYFDKGGATTLNFQYEGPSVSKKPVPNGAFYRVKADAFPSLQVTSPSAGSQVLLGQPLVIKYKMNNYKSGTFGIVLSLSLNNGLYYEPLTQGGSYPLSAETGEFTFNIPNDPAYLTDQAVIQLAEYNTQAEGTTSAAFKIVSTLGVRTNGIYYDGFKSMANNPIVVYSTNGKAIPCVTNSATAQAYLKGNGVYYVREMRNGKMVTRKVARIMGR